MPEDHLESLRAPLHPGSATLRVRDLERVSDFYEHTLGLDVIAREPGRNSFGAGGVAFLRLEGDPNLLLAPQSAAGLFHIAYLVPSHDDLVAWLHHAVARGAALVGQADHLVSEALYLEDPEGNGIEVYCDKPRDTWQWEGDQVVMANVRMDLRSMMDEGARMGDRGQRMPAGTRIGHMHLKVGDIAAAERFYVDVVGMQPVRRRAGASFLSTGRYHHHLAVNTWQSAGAGTRDTSQTGLASFELVARDAGTHEQASARLLAAGGRRVGENIAADDPWGTRLVLRRG